MNNIDDQFLEVKLGEIYPFCYPINSSVIEIFSDQNLLLASTTNVPSHALKHFKKGGITTNVTKHNTDGVIIQFLFLNKKGQPKAGLNATYDIRFNTGTGDRLILPDLDNDERLSLDIHIVDFETGCLLVKRRFTFCQKCTQDLLEITATQAFQLEQSIFS